MADDTLRPLEATHRSVDDIVTRLRDGDRCESFCDVCTSPHLLALQAADDIERLRSAGDALLHMIQTGGRGMRPADMAEIVAGWREARNA